MKLLPSHCRCRWCGRRRCSRLTTRSSSVFLNASVPHHTTPESCWYYRLWKNLLILGSATFVAEKHGQVYFLGFRIHGMLNFRAFSSNCDKLRLRSKGFKLQWSANSFWFSRISWTCSGPSTCIRSGLTFLTKLKQKTHLLLWCNRQVAHGAWTLLGSVWSEWSDVSLACFVEAAMSKPSRCVLKCHRKTFIPVTPIHKQYWYPSPL